MTASAASDKDVETTLHLDPELYEPARREDLYDLKVEIADLNSRLDALVEAVRMLGRDHYKPVPAGSLTRELARAERDRPFLLHSVAQ